MRLRILSLFAGLFMIYASKGFGQRISYQVKIVYRLDYQPDSTNNEGRKYENMLLLIDGSSSVFKSFNHVLSDSAELARQNSSKPLTFSLRNQSDFKFTIYKDSSDLLKFRDDIFLDHFEYVESKHFSWVILDDTLTLNGYSCQKAETNYSGRKWIAWFSNQIPASEGPYKFNGLPGLIFKVTDSKNHYNFELIELIRQNGSIYQPDIKFNKVSKEKYYKLLSNFIENRYEIVSTRTNIIRGEESIRNRMEEDRKKKNNPIELLQQ